MHWLRKWLGRSARPIDLRTRPDRQPPRRLLLEVLEDRLTPALLTVNSLADTSNNGVLTFRDAMLVENGSLSVASLSPSEQSQINGTLHAVGGDTIQFTADLAGQTIRLTTFDDTTFGNSAFLVNSQVTVQGDATQRITIARDTNAADYPGGTLLAFRLFNVATTGNLTLENVTLQNGLAQGGNGSSATGQNGGEGGGGAAGLGGAIFSEGTINLTQTSLTGNAAIGGNGGVGDGLPPVVFGGGGGGVGGDGGSGGADREQGGGPNGGAGGFFPNGSGNNVAAGSPGGFGGGGGGGGGVGGFGSHGADGGFGGGGGGGGGGQGGAGGFGGGGGGGDYHGFSGGGPGAGGFGGGAGATRGGGGGGAGLGGALFNATGTVSITNCTLTGNTAQGGAGSGGGNGSGLGGAVFNLNGSVTLTSDTLTSNTVASGGSGGSADGVDFYTLGLNGVLVSDGGSPVGSASGARGSLSGTTFGNGTGSTHNFVNNNSSVSTLTPGSVPGPIVYDAAANFSPSSNPNGPWSYGWTQTLGSSFTPDTTSYTGASLEGWSGPVNNYPYVELNASTSTFTGNDTVFPPGQMILEPGPNGEYSAVRWTAPVAETLSLNVSFVGLAPNPATTTDVHVLANGVRIFDGTVNDYGSSNAANFVAPNVSVTAGETIDFVVGDGTDGTHFSDETGLNVTITQVAGPASNAVNATAGAAFSGPVASFSDTNLNLGPSDFTASINWGDGTSSNPDVTSGTIIALGSGQFSVGASHTYAVAGIYPLSVGVQEAGGSSVTVNGMASVSTGVVTWTGAAGDNSFQTPGNWDAGRVPLATDNVVINATGITITSSANVSVFSIRSQASLDITGGSFQVTSGASTINAALTVASGASLAATGAGTSFTASGTTVIDNADVYATAGATVTLPGVTSYTNAVNNATVLEASGVGSVLSLPHLTSITTATLAYYFYAYSYALTEVQALAGGDVELPALTSINGGQDQLTSDGAGSVLNVSALTSFSGSVPFQNYGSFLHVTNHGTLKDNSPVAIAGVDLVVDATGTFPYSQLTALTGANVTLPAGTLTFSALTTVDGSTFPSVSGQTLNMPVLTSANGTSFTIGTGMALSAPSLANIDNANFVVSGGSTVSLPGVKSYTNAVNHATVLEATDAGSVLSLPNLVSISTATLGVYYYTYSYALTEVEALAGGDVELPALTAINGGQDQLTSDGAGSVLNVSALTSFSGSVPFQNYGSFLHVTNHGTLKDTSLVAIAGVDLVVDSTSTFPYGQLTALTGASLTLSAGTFTFSALASVDGSTFSLVSDQTLNLPVLTSANGASYTVNGGSPSLPALASANGARFTVNGGSLSLPALTSANGSSFVVSGGASVTVSGLTTYSGDGTLEASGTNSVLSFPNLGTFTAGGDPAFSSSPSAFIEALAGGKVALPALTQVGGGPVLLEADGASSVLDLATLASYSVNPADIAQSGQSLGTFRATNGGTIADGDLTNVSSANVILDGTGTFSYSQITSFTGSSIAIPGGTFDFSSLTDADGSAFTVSSGATLDMPAVTSANGFRIVVDSGVSLSMPVLTSADSASFTISSGGALAFPVLAHIDNASFVVSGGSTVNLPHVASYTNNINGVTTLSASGVGSVLSLPNLASMTANTNNDFGFHSNELTQVKASSGGDVEMLALTQMSGGPIQLTSDGAGSVLNVSALSSFTGVSNGFQNQSEIVATNGGTLKDGSLVTLVYVNGILPPRPDLVPSGVAAPASGLPLQGVPVTWTLTNAGSADATGPWTEQILLATDAAGDNPTLLQASAYAGPLGQGKAVGRSATVTLPNVAPGNYWLVVRENPLGEVIENLTANNTAVSVSPIAVSGGLTLALASHQVSDGAGGSATTATVTRNTATTNALVVTLANSDPAGVSIPATVTIPAGQASVTFPVGTINPGVVVGTQTATLTASATGLASGSDILTVTDVNVPTLTLSLGSHAIDESAANPATTGTLTRNTDTTTPLVVALFSSATGKLSVPATVTIPAGQASATFSVTVVNDQQIDGDTTVTATASAAGFVTGADSAVVIDANIPALALTLAQQTVSEGAGLGATTGTVSIGSPARTPVTVALTSSDTTAGTVPATVVIAAGQTSAHFAVTAVDDALVLGDKVTTITARVETNAGVLVSRGAASTNLLLEEADGPALALNMAGSVVNKGTTTTATVTRNTDTTVALVVNLSSSDLSRATVPASVTIPAGQASASFPVTTLDNHTPDGLQQVQLSASVGGLVTGLATLGITDVDLPDLSVAAVTAPTSSYDGASLPISWTVTNSGQYPAAGLWQDQVYLDPVDGPLSSTPVDTVPFTGTVNAGQAYTQTDTLTFPATVGQYTVRIVADSGHSLQELSFTNNTASSQALDDRAAYQVSVSTTATTVSAGTPVRLTGAATLSGSGTPAAYVPVAVEIMVAGTTRTLTAVTDATGHYAVTFQPLAKEAGLYSVAAADPGVTNPAVQAHFTIVGMTASPAVANVKVVPGTPLTGQFTLTDLSATALTGLTATASGGPAGVSVQLTPPGQVAGGGTATLAYRIDATGAHAGNGVVTIHVAAAEGAVLDILLEVTVLPLTASLTADPGFLNTGMVVGTPSFVSFTVVNHGGAPSGDLQVSLPSTSYLSLASAATIPSLQPGASSTVTLQLSPPANLPLAQYTGTLAVSNGQAGIGVPFTFTALTSAVGSIHVLVDDDYTFDVTGSPHVQGAMVSLLNPYDNTQVVATGVTDASGAITFESVPAGPYVLQVQASGHSTYNSSYTVVPGITNNDEVFIARQFVSYTWNVVQTTIQDTYQIKLQTEFQTDVPAPVVTISAPSTLPTLQPGQSTTINATITNHGLIAAQGVTLNLPTDPEYTFTALSTDLGTLGAKSSVVVPITVTRIAPQTLSINDAGTTFTAKVIVPSPVGLSTASTVYVQYANTGTVAIPAPLLVLTATQDRSRGAFLSFDSSLAGLAYNSNATPAGFSPVVQLLASGATAGVLQPGESVTVPVYYAGWLASQWDSSPVTFSLSEANADNVQPINWLALAPGLRPSSIGPAAWNAIAPLLVTQLGSTWGQYVQQLDKDAAYLAGLGEPTNDLDQLLSFEIEKANAGYTAQTLTSITAASLPAPGMSLSFAQSFQQSISGRYTEGILGFGWTTNWDISANTQSNGDVLIKGPGVTDHYSLQPDGTFVADPDDQGATLTSSAGSYQLHEFNGTVYQFNANGTLNEVQDIHGNRITAGYNDLGQLASLTAGNGEFLKLTYNAQGHLVKLTDSTGQSETYSYDPTGQFLTAYTDVTGTTNYTYVSGSSAAQDNALAEIAYPNNTQVDFLYDTQGRLIDAHLNGGAADQSIAYLNPGGYVVTDANGNKNTVYFDRFGAAAQTIDALGNITRSSYDSHQHLTGIVIPGGATYAYTYDQNGNLVTQTDPLGLKTIYTYDVSNNLTSSTDPAGNKTIYSYDATNNLQSITYANGTTQQYSYDPLGEAKQLIDAKGQASNYTYNTLGLVTGEQFADGTSLAFTYDARGNMTSATDTQGKVTTFQYSNSSDPDLLTEVDYPDGTFLKYSYNTVGQRTQSIDQTGFTLQYSYDALGRLATLSQVTGNNSTTLVVQYTYDKASNLIQKDMGNGTRTIYTYDGDGNVLSITNYASAGGTVNSFDVYTYEALGNELTDTNQDGKWVYTYDADSQLTDAVFTPNSTDPDGLTAQTIQYVDDPAGNRKSESVNGVITTYTVNNVNEYTEATTNGVDTIYQYDANGNRTSEATGSDTTTYTFNGLNQLTAITGPGVTASYAYNAIGQRRSQTINGVATRFQVDPAGLGNLVATLDAGGTVTAHFTYGLGLVSRIDGPGSAAYYDFNNIGSTIGITTTGGTYLNRYAYLPFGQTTTAASGIANAFAFAGQFGVQDDGTGLFNMRARPYDPATGHFLSNDPLGISGGDTNIRRYVGNNPTGGVDPTGLETDYVKEAVDFAYNDPVLGFIGSFVGLDYLKLAFDISRAEDCLSRATIAGEFLGKKVGKGVGGTIYLAATHYFPLAGGILNVANGAVSNLIGKEIDIGEKVLGKLGGKLGKSLGSALGNDIGNRICNDFSPSDLPFPDGGPCTLVLEGSSFYPCGPNDVTSQFSSLLNVPGRDCDAQDVMDAFASPGESGPGGTFFTGAAVQSPAIVIPYNCNPDINSILQQVALAEGDAAGGGGAGGGSSGSGSGSGSGSSGGSGNGTGSGTGSGAGNGPGSPSLLSGGPGGISGSNGAPGNSAPGIASGWGLLPWDCKNLSPLTFIATTFGNLGLLIGQNGNAGYTPAQLAQMATTIATFDQTEADLAGIFATAAGKGSSLGITGDLNLLHTIDARLQAVITAENSLFGGDANWLDTKEPATLQQWLTAFFTAAQASSDGTISTTARTQLLAITLPKNISISEANEFLDRWNRTVQYWGQGIYMVEEVPSGLSTDFYDLCAVYDYFSAAKTAEQECQVDGYTDVGAQAQAILAQVQTDLTGQGVCATVKLQIDQTATLTRSAFAGTLTITNSEDAGALGNVVMNINITDAQGNPANGKFFVSSPSYSGGFNVVNGIATLPQGTTGSVAFTFIPNDTAAPTAPTLYRIGGTIGFTDPDGGAITTLVFPATITVLPQAQLKVNYFLQQTVIGADPFNPQEVIPSEPAVLGMLVMNVGAGTANNLTIATAQPTIIQNDKGLLVNIQIIGTQVGTQQVTPSLTVNFGDIAPGQTGDAVFLLTSSLQGTFTDFTASFTHSDALGGQATSLIKSVQTHTLVHAGDFQFPGSSGEIDYLTEETANPGNLPDTIFFSNGTTAPVNLASNAMAAPAGAQTYTVTASVTSGWDYLQLPDPGAGDTLSKVVRSDGTIVPIGDQAWTSDRTISSTGKSMVDHQLHILDLNSTGSYTVYYTSHTALAPTVTLTAPADGSVSTNTEPTLTAQVTDRSGTGLASVQFQYSSDGGVTWLNAGPAETSSPFLFTLSSPLAPGTFQARVGATDNAGNIATSAAVTFTVLTAPVITSSTANFPASAVALTIQGSGFDTNPANDRVIFDNGVTGTVTGATPTSMTVSVSGLNALTAGTALHASVSIASLSSGSAVQVANVAPVVTTSTANLSANATTLVIHGASFDTDPTHDLVSLSSGTGTVVLASATSLTINVSGLVAGNLLAIVTTDGVDSGSPVQVAVITPVTPILTWNNPADISYGTPLGSEQLDAGANVPGSFSYTLVNGFTPASGAVLKAGQAQVLNVTFTPADTTNYRSATASVRINVLKVTPTILWTNPADIPYGTVLGSNQLNATANVAGTLTYTLADRITSANGVTLHAGAGQTLNVTFTPSDATDYNTATDTVTLNVLHATPNITWANPAEIVYGTALGMMQLDATSNVPGTFSYSPASGTVLNAGLDQTLSVTFTPNDTADYNTATASVTINVNKAAPILSWTNPADIVFGTALDSTQLNATANVPGTFSYSPGSNTVLPAGANQLLTATFMPSDSIDYNASSAQVALNILPTVQPVTQTAFAGTAVSFLAVTGLPTPTMQWQQSIDGGPFTNIDGATSAAYTFLTAAGQAGSRYRYHAVLTTPGGNITTDAATLTVNTDLTILTRPAPQIVPIGQKATFSATASGTTKPTVQWQVSSDNGSTFSNIGGATSTTLTFPVTAGLNGNLYRAVFSNSAGQAATTAAKLTVNFALIGKQPQAVTVAAGTPFTLTAAALGSAGARVQWQVSPKKGQPFIVIPGATELSYTFTPQQTDSGKLYQAVFSTPTGTRTGVVTLTVDIPPTAGTGPANQTVTAGTSQKATFTASFASGTPTPKVQWQVSSDGGLTYSNIPGATAATLTLSPITASQDRNRYRALYSNPVGQSSTTAGVLTVTYAPIITQPPRSQTVLVGQTATFTAAAGGDPTPTKVQWQVSGDGGKTYSNIPEANSTTLTVPAFAVQNRNLYRAVFSNSAGTTASAAAKLTVNFTLQLAGQPLALTVAPGTPITLTTVLPPGGVPVKVQWQVRSNNGQTFTNIRGATGAAYTFTAQLANNGNLYQVLITKGSSTTTTATFALTVDALPTVTITPRNQTVATGQTATFMAMASGTPTSALQWQVSTDGGQTFTNIAGATSTQLIVSNVTVGQNRSKYRAVFTNPAGQVFSDVATLTVS